MRGWEVESGMLGGHTNGERTVLVASSSDGGDKGSGDGEETHLD
jgi:hypothetical protein